MITHLKEFRKHVCVRAQCNKMADIGAGIQCALFCSLKFSAGLEYFKIRFKGSLHSMEIDFQLANGFKVKALPLGAPISRASNCLLSTG